MGYSEERSKIWRDLHHQAIQKWQETLKTRLSWGGYFNDERLEMEVLQLLEGQDMKAIWSYACQYVRQQKPAKLRNMLLRAKTEIERFGTLEPLWRQELFNLAERDRKRRKYHG